MKNKMFLSIILLAGLATTASAQKKDTPALPVKSGNEWQMPKDVLIHARNFADRCRKLLALDSATTQKLFQLYLGNTKSVDEIRIGKNSQKEKEDAIAANQRQFDQQVKPLITPAQFDLYLRERRAGRL